MFRHKALLGFMLLITSLLISCKPGVPKGVIKPDKMESVLYDMAIANSVSSLNGSSSKQSLVMRYTVLDKYDITESEFDSSMVYYTRHTEQLHDIYENISKRLDEESKNQGSSMGAMAGSVNGDTTNIWRGPVSKVLVPNYPFNSQSFEVQADSSFHKGDHIILSFDTQYIFQDGMRDGVAVLAVTFGNDSTAQQTLHMSMANHYTLEIDDAQQLGIKQIKGFFLLNKQNNDNNSLTTLKLLLISNISLLKMHVHSQPANMQSQAGGPDTTLKSTGNTAVPVPDTARKVLPQGAPLKMN